MPFPDSLDAVLRDCEERLGRAPRDRNCPMHTPVVATADGDLRVMVLRACTGQPDLLRFHTDARSPKVAVLARDPAAAVLAYDPAARVQIRMRGRARIETAGSVADSAWRTATAFARRCYLIEPGPGTVLQQAGTGLSPDLAARVPSEDELLPARVNFAVLLFEPLALDWLHLAHSGHRRACFARQAAGRAWQGHWAVP